ncbi:hypothetical protein D6817_05175 [Candidatus Pacearchaeota archaeon]|nr:MAG: hypothetical protein D6817_05175 [Candidatus Pacearchaeota archaeon]
MQRRALSNVVATVLLIIVTITGVLIIAGIVVPLVRNTLANASSCTDYQAYFSFSDEFGFNCFDSSTNTYIISVSAKPTTEELASKVEGFYLVFKTSTSSESAEVKGGNSPGTNGITMTGDSTAPIAIPRQGQTFTYNYTVASGSPRFSKVEIVPILEGGHACTKTDVAEIRDC